MRVPVPATPVPAPRRACPVPSDWLAKSGRRAAYLPDDVVVLGVENANLRRHHHVVVLGLVVPRRTQAVTAEQKDTETSDKTHRINLHTPYTGVAA